MRSNTATAPLPSCLQSLVFLVLFTASCKVRGHSDWSNWCGRVSQWQSGGQVGDRKTVKLGMAGEGALADLLLVDGDPLANLRLIEDPDNNFVVIMKDDELCKDLFSRRSISPSEICERAPAV
jgi:hypothetical protein